MGDRANIVMQSEGKRIFFYSHDGGYNLPSTAQEGLKRGEDRWDDQSYLARIVFSTMIKGREREVYGFGISTSINDNSYPLLVIDTDQKKVIFEDADGFYGSYKHAIGKEFTFEEFLALDFDGHQEWQVISGLPDE